METPVQRIIKQTSADELYRGSFQVRRRVAAPLRAFELGQIHFDAAHQGFDIHTQINRLVRQEFFHARAPELHRADGHLLLQFVVAGGDLNDALIKFPLLPVLLQPDLLERLVTLEEKPLVELIDAL